MEIDNTYRKEREDMGLDSILNFFKIPDDFDDEYEVQTTMAEFNRAKMVFSYKVINVQDGKVLVEGTTTNVFADKDGKIIRLAPEWFDKINQAYLAEAKTEKQATRISRESR